MSYTLLEDYFGDIVGKALRGLGVSESDATAATGLTGLDLRRIASYDLIPDDATIRSLAALLGLDGDKLAGVARGWVPDGGNDPLDTDALAVDRAVLSAGMEVNAYVMKCKATGEGVIVDAGGQADKIFDLVARMQARITHIFLTHGHGDHVGAVAEVKRATGAPVHCSDADAGMLGHRSDVDVIVGDGWTGRVGQIDIDARSLPGHTAGGIGYNAGAAFFSGDALFAGSLGGARGRAYTGQIEAVRQKVLSLADDVRIFPGHGPMTTVAQEKRQNPYFKG